MSNHRALNKKNSPHMYTLKMQSNILPINILKTVVWQQIDWSLEIGHASVSKTLTTWKPGTPQIWMGPNIVWHSKLGPKVCSWIFYLYIKQSSLAQSNIQFLGPREEYPGIKWFQYIAEKIVNKPVAFLNSSIYRLLPSMCKKIVKLIVRSWC